MVEAVIETIDDRTVGEDRGETAPAGLEHIVLASDVDKALVLSGEAGRRKIFRGRGAADGDSDVTTVLVLQLAIGRGDLPTQVAAAGCRIDDLARLCCARR